MDLLYVRYNARKTQDNDKHIVIALPIVLWKPRTY